MNAKRILSYIHPVLLGISGTLCLLFFSGCHNNDITESPKTPLRITNVSTQTFASRGENNWKEGDKIQLQFSSGIPELSFTMYNNQWKAERNIYYEDLAYPPCTYTATYGSNSLCTDQSTDEKYRQCDYMSTDENETITGPELEILLKHRSVDIIIHIVHAGKVDAMAFNAGNLLIHTKDGATVTPLSLGNADMDNTRTWQAHLPSDNVIDPDGSALFSFFFDGKEYPAKYSLANAKDVIASGTRLIVTANFNFKLDAVAIEILSWTDEKQSPDGVSPDI
jgi:hypothetical protein